MSLSATIAAEHELHVQSIRATELSKAEGVMRVERHNKDIHLHRLELEKAEERRTFIEVAQTVVATVSSRMGAFIRDPEAVAKTVGVLPSYAEPKFGNIKRCLPLSGALGAVFLAYHGAKVGASVTGNHVASILGRPALVRETSRKSLSSTRDIIRLAAGSRQASAKGLSEIVLAPVEVFILLLWSCTLLTTWPHV